MLSALLLAAGSGHADQASQRADPAPNVPVIRVSIDRVQIDAVVCDGADRSVADLEPRDFTLLVNGMPQGVANVVYVEAGLGARGAADSGTRRRAPRCMLVIFDDLGISPLGAAAAKSAMERFAREPFEGGDHVGLVRTGQDDPGYTFYGSSEELLAASAKLRGNLRSMSGQDMRDEIPAMLRGTFAHRIHSIVGAIDGLRGLPGRKAVVLVSEGFSVNRGSFRRAGLRTVYDSLFYDDSAFPDEDIQETLRLVTEIANRASVVVYALDPRGVVGGLPAGQDSLQDLAGATGGLCVMNRNDLLGGLRRIVADQAGYYLLGFEPPPSTFEKASGKPRFHSVEVRVNRPGLKVRSRSGFYGVTDDEVARLVPGGRP
jgi:VWFA-related protein